MPPTGRTPLPRERMIGLVVGMFALLTIQNLSGIWVNLFVSLGDSSSYSNVFPTMFSSSAGAVHTVFGILIGLNAILMIGMTWRAPDRRPRSLAILVLLLVAVAAYSGFHFVAEDGNDTFSFVMELAFMGIVVGEAGLLYLAARAPPALDAPLAAAPA